MTSDAVGILQTTFIADWLLSIDGKYVVCPKLDLHAFKTLRTRPHFQNSFSPIQNYCILFQIPLMFAPKGSTENRSVLHYSDVIMSAMASQTNGISIVFSISRSGVDQRKHQRSTVTGDRHFPSHKANNAENVPTRWRNHVATKFQWWFGNDNTNNCLEDGGVADRHFDLRFFFLYSM